MKGIELLKQYPKAGEVVLEWYKDKMKASLNSETLTEEIKESFKGFTVGNEHMGTIIDNNPRMLFDVFDENDLYIEILVNYASNSAKFTYTVIDDEILSNTTNYASRKDAETAAIELAFKLLNDK